MTSIFSKFNILLVMIWGEVIVFVSSLIISSQIIKLISSIFSKISYKMYDCLKISTTLFMVVIIQYLYKNILTFFLRKNIIKTILVVNSSALSIFLIDKIIRKMVFSKYTLFYPALFISFILPFIDEILSILKVRSEKVRGER
jgi:hypothetical protein